MLVELKEASVSDGRDIFELIVEIGPGRMDSSITDLIWLTVNFLISSGIG